MRRAGWRLPSSMPPTRSRCRPSSDRRIGFLDIPRVVEDDVERRRECERRRLTTLDGVLAADARARMLAEEICRRVVV